MASRLSCLAEFEEPAGVDHHHVGAGVVGRQLVALGAQLGDDALASRPAPWGSRATPARRAGLAWPAARRAFGAGFGGGLRHGAACSAHRAGNANVGAPGNRPAQPNRRPQALYLERSCRAEWSRPRLAVQAYVHLAADIRVVTNRCCCNAASRDNNSREEPHETTSMAASGRRLGGAGDGHRARKRRPAWKSACSPARARGSHGLHHRLHQGAALPVQPARAATSTTAARIDKFGIDIGSTKQATIAWAVLAPDVQPAAPLAQRHLRRRQRRGDGRRGRRRQRAGRRLAALDHPAAAERAGAAGPQHRRRRRRCSCGGIAAFPARAGRLGSRLHPAARASQRGHIEQAHGGRGHVGEGRGLQISCAPPACPRLLM